jgi:hypothetical protein
VAGLVLIVAFYGGLICIHVVVILLWYGGVFSGRSDGLRNGLGLIL